MRKVVGLVITAILMAMAGCTRYVVALDGDHFVVTKTNGANAVYDCHSYKGEDGQWHTVCRPVVVQARKSIWGVQEW